jgi:hypothetical protein
MKYTTFSILTLLTLIAAPMQAALLVYEQFDYDATNDIDGLNGGDGFSGAWDMTETGGGGDNDFVQVTSPGLTYAGLDSAGNTALTPGDSDSTVWASRSLDSSFGADGTTVWIGVLQSFANGSSNNFGGLLLTDSGTPTFGIGDPDTDGDPDDWGIGAGTFTNSAGGGFATVARSTTDIDSTARWLVTRIDFASGNDTANFWVDPDLNSEPTIGSADATLTAAITFDGIRLLTGSGDNYRLNVDEIRIGDSYSDVTVIPEPSAAALLLACGSLLLLRRRR